MGRGGFPSGNYRDDDDAAAAAAAAWAERPAEAKSRHLPRVRTRAAAAVVDHDGDYYVSSDEEEGSTTPTAREARIPDRLPCPPAPRKRRPPLACGHALPGGAAAREFFHCPPDLEAVFGRRKQPAK